jgi:hypothetical protein
MVKALGQQVDHCVGLRNVQRHARMQREEVRQDGREDVIEIGCARVNPHAAHRLLAGAGCALGILDVGKDASCALVEGTPFRREQ